MRREVRRKERRETGEKEGSETDERKAERGRKREGERDKGIWPSPDDCFRFGQPCQPLGLQTERF